MEASEASTPELWEITHRSREGSSLAERLRAVWRGDSQRRDDEAEAERPAEQHGATTYETVRELLNIDLPAFERARSRAIKHEKRPERVSFEDKLLLHQGIIAIAKARLASRNATELVLEHPEDHHRVRIHANERGTLEKIAYDEPTASVASADGTTEILKAFVPGYLLDKQEHHDALRQENTVGSYSAEGDFLGSQIQQREPAPIELVRLEPYLVEGIVIKRRAPDSGSELEDQPA